MPKYDKFLKYIANKKDKFEGQEVIPISTNCSSLIKKDIFIPAKLKDPGSICIPCDIGSRHFEKALCDLGSGVSLMPLSIATAMGLNEFMKPIPIMLQLADHSLVKPNGIIEDLWVQVDRFIIPVDFVILDMEVDKKVPIILGRPFMATGDTVIWVNDKEVTFQINGEEATVNCEP